VAVQIFYSSLTIVFRVGAAGANQGRQSLKFQIGVSETPFPFFNQSYRLLLAKMN
jgi:hypothetical protein